jgi:ribose 5-phosphate isomerase B
MKWIVGSDHAGLVLKRHLSGVLEALGDEVEDLGCDSEESVDYPDFASAVARRVSQGGAMGLLVCGTGQGMAITANKVEGVRAAVASDTFSAHATRAHNDANVLALGSRVVGSGLAEEVLRAFRDTPFEGGRHVRRVAKIEALEGSRDGE